MKKKSLGELCDIVSGGTPSRSHIEYWDKGSIPWIKIGNIKGKYVSTSDEYITQAGLDGSSAKMLPKGTLLYTIFATLGEVGILTIEACTNQAIAGISIKHNNEISTDFLYYYLKSKKSYVNKIGRGVAQNNINMSILRALEVPVPNIAEQSRIVSVLDSVASVVTIRQQQLEKLDELVKARFVEMFGDLANPDCQWDSTRLAEACTCSNDIKCGPFGTQLSKDEYTESGVAVWEIPQINNAFQSKPTHFLTPEKATQLGAYSIISGDIAMSRKGNVGKCALFPENFADGIIHSDVLRIRVDKKRVNPIFMLCQLHFSTAVTHQIELVSSGAIMAGVNVTKLKQIYVYIPPKDLQEQFATFVKQINKSKVAVQKSLDEAQHLFDCLMQEYFS